ncbi:methyltransferase domain-containing protein [Actinomadura rubrisoli]|uniref:Protein-L-isoaspartate O-methyltransferase n=1 Tax=Actinomadura rubrisoli TaxID=2530368 RepID=A0A4R5CAA0_9ACTN|nr:methyltransferase domain-containing protein [Actinomadura rubrisoli]TDD96851.1 methyltransferase domain-containing protein [Actinomadura rubrisoli]
MNARDAVNAIPRETFIPEVIWTYRDDGWSVPVRRDREPERWAELAGSGDSIVIQMDDGRAVEKGAWPTSSSTAPEGIVTVIEALDLRPGMRILEIGAGSGFNAAVLAFLLGAENVTTVDIDRALADHARQALDRAGYPVEVITGDGTKGHAPGAPFDRIVATASVHTLPYAWVQQTVPGGIVLAPWAATFHPDCPLAKLTVRDDGSAEGRFIGPGFYMPVRDQRVSQRVMQETKKRWAKAGHPDCTRYGVTVTPEGQRIWLDSPERHVAPLTEWR